MTPLAFVAVASLICWLFILVTGLLYTRPADVDAGPPTLDLRAESPALVNFLVNGWRMTQDAATATLIDLAARKAITFSQQGPDPKNTLIHVPPDKPAGLRGYEYQILAHVTSLARGGALPAAALVRGDDSQTDDLWSTFSGEVVADAKALGLTQPRWSKPMLAVLNIASFVPSAMAGVVILERHGEVMAAILCCVVVWAVLAGIVARRQRERDTAAGREAAAHWLGYQAYLLQDEQFRTLPPAAVQIWDRHLAYAATFGAARTAAKVLPLGAHDYRHAWSAYGGSWHRVAIRYPHRWGWGKSPLRIGVNGLVRSVVGGVGLHYLLELKRSGYAFDNLVRFLTDRHQWIFGVGFALAGWFLLTGVVKLALAIAERITRRERRGEVVRIVRQADSGSLYVAMTDGFSAKTRAYRIFHEPTNHEVTSTLREGGQVHLVAGRYLGHVTDLRSTS